jgi:very-long-chain (3R)-3-hydroxyacyl-CoA dehydratase
MTLAVTSWSLVEVPRYLFYALNIFNAVPYPLLWLRYSLFAVLYPTGITGELGCMYHSIFDLKGDYVRRMNLFFIAFRLYDTIFVRDLLRFPYLNLYY